MPLAQCDRFSSICDGEALFASITPGNRGNSSSGFYTSRPIHCRSNAEDDLVVFKHDEHRVAIRPLDSDLFTFTELFLRDAYGLNAMQLPLGDVVNLGANIGLFAVRIAPMAERVISVKPVEANMRVARRNISLAALEDRVILRRYAVTPQPRDRTRLFLSQGNHGGHSISAEHAAQWGAAGCEDVPAITLAELFDREQISRCSLLKCDIEGDEFGIVATMSQNSLPASTASSWKSI